jgi:hypothetical protein
VEAVIWAVSLNTDLVPEQWGEVGLFDSEQRLRDGRNCLYYPKFTDRFTKKILQC